MSDEKSPKPVLDALSAAVSGSESPRPFSPTQEPIAPSPRPASQVQSTTPIQNGIIPGAAPAPEVKLKIHDYQYSQQELTLRPIQVEAPAEEEDDEDEGSRPMFDAPNTPANWALWIGALLLMSFFIAAAIWMMYKLPS